MQATIGSDSPPALAFSLSREYLKAGLRLLRQDVLLFLRLVACFSLPALASAVVAVALPISTLWTALLIFLLQSLTTAVAPVVFMMLVGAVAKGRATSVRQVVLQALPWLPRYLWTNVHTSVIFWAPVGGLVLLQGWSSQPLIEFGLPHLVQLAGWGLLLSALTIYLHAHTLLAPFLAVHGDLPASLATLESWRLTERHLPLVLATFLLAFMPAALPLFFVVLLLVALYGSFPLIALVLPHLTGVALQCIRLFLIPAVYVMYGDLWSREQERRTYEGQPSVPLPVRLLLAATAWLPHPALGTQKE